jgi:hypothetical protein
VKLTMRAVGTLALLVLAPGTGLPAIRANELVNSLPSCSKDLKGQDETYVFNCLGEPDKRIPASATEAATWRYDVYGTNATEPWAAIQMKFMEAPIPAARRPATSPLLIAPPYPRPEAEGILSADRRATVTAVSYTNLQNRAKFGCDSNPDDQDGQSWCAHATEDAFQAAHPVPRGAEVEAQHVQPPPLSTREKIEAAITGAGNAMLMHRVCTALRQKPLGLMNRNEYRTLLTCIATGY